MEQFTLKAKKYNVMGINIHAIRMNEVLDHIDKCIRYRQKLQIGVVNAAKIVNMKRTPNLKADVLSSDIILADGSAVVWASRVLGRPLPERVTGIDLMYNLLERGKQNKYRVFCLGASEEISKKVSEIIKREYKGVILSGRHHGYFQVDEEEDVAKLIANAKPDILFVAITSPKKENFLAKWSKLINVPICHGVGGSFDVMAGKVERAPKNWQRLGLEWLYRLKQEPKRMWRRYFVTNSLFILLLTSEFIKSRLFSKRK